MRHLGHVTMRADVSVIQANETGGAFWVRSRPGAELLKVIVSFDFGWDHVSVSTRRRCPTWDEMEYIKRMFFEDHETCMQLHVPPSDHVSYAKYALHMCVRRTRRYHDHRTGWLVLAPEATTNERRIRRDQQSVSVDA